MNPEKENIAKTPFLTAWPFVFIIVAMVSRFVLPPFLGHPENFSPIDAIALFSGAYLGRNYLAFLTPLLSVWLSDWIVNFQYYHKIVLFYPGFFWQYGFYLLVVLVSSFLWKKHQGARLLRVPLVSLGVSVAFFLVSNFGVWAGGLLYPHTWQGLGICYLAGLPFFKGTLVSDLMYCTVLFGGMEWIRRVQRIQRVQRVPVVPNVS